MNQIIVRTGHAADPIYNYRFVESHAIPVAVRVRVIIGRKPISIENFIQPPLRRKSMRPIGRPVAGTSLPGIKNCNSEMLP